MCLSAAGVSGGLMGQAVKEKKIPLGLDLTKEAVKDPSSFLVGKAASESKPVKKVVKDVKTNLQIDRAY
tara:strand:- start:332 stop:538 length:207 start_codon:yes stop_codon:yes gene_type:complete